MTAKDLNLLTDPAKLAAWAEENALSAPPVTDGQAARSSRPRADLSAVPREGTQAKSRARKVPESSQTTPSPPTRKPPAPRAATTAKARVSGDRQWLLTATIAIANMLFIGLAAIWLTGTDLKGGLAVADSNNLAGANTSLAALEETNKRLAAVTLELNTVKAQLDTLGNQLALLSPLQERPTLPTEAPGAVADNPETANSTQPASTAESASANTPPRTTSWQVNLGDYASRKEARAAQRTLQKIGLQAQINPLPEGGSQGFLVSISGFADRQDAEAVASEIMVDTQLNGLWVARSP